MARASFLGLLVTAVTFILAAGPAAAQKGFERLRTFRADLQQGRITQVFPRTQKTHTAFQIRVRSGRIAIRRINMVFWNGQRVIVNRRFNLVRNRSTPVLAANSRGRRLRRLIIFYARQPSRSALLELRGRPAAAIAPPGRVAKPGRPAKSGRVDRNLKKEPEKRVVILKRPQPKIAQAPIRRKSAQKSADESVTAPAPNTAARQRRPSSTARNQAGNRRTTTRRYYRRSAPADRRAAAPQPPSATPPAASPPSAPTPTLPPLANDQPSATSRAPASAAGQPGCVGRGTCTPVRVFFATNRERDQQREAEVKRVSFGGNRNEADTIEDELTLGRAIVTVPRTKRQLGSINTPGWAERWKLWLTGRSPEGDPDKHFIIYGDGYKIFTSEAGFLAEVARHRQQAGRYKDHAFVFVHGYNTSFDLALMRTAQIAYDLGDPGDTETPIKPFGTPFLFSWPSAGGEFWSELLYAYDQESSRFAIEHFKHFLQMVVEKSGAKKVHLIAHSMGNVSMMNALAGLKDWANGKTIVEQVILASPDIDVGEFKRLAARVKPLTKGMTMYASSKDAAMSLSKRVHYGRPRAGDVVAPGPIVADGVHSIDISAITRCYFCTGHNEYVDQKDLLNDITLLLREDQILPPHRRTEQLRPETVSGVGDFWRYYLQ